MDYPEFSGVEGHAEASGGNFFNEGAAKSEREFGAAATEDS